jgi:hypothetical protein
MASSHEQTIIDILPCLCLFPPTLDGSRFPRRDVGDTGEISEGWLASTELQTRDDQSHHRGQEALGQVRDDLRHQAVLGHV